MTPGGTFPDYELTDHTKTRRKLSELQGIDPMILLLSRGGYCPKDHQQHLELVASYSKIAVAYTQIVTISTDNLIETNEFPLVGRRAVDVPVRCRTARPAGSRHPGVHRPAPQPDGAAYVRAQAGAGDPQHLQRVLVLGPALIRGPASRPAGGHARDPAGLGPGRAGPAGSLGRGRALGVLPLRGSTRELARRAPAAPKPHSPRSDRSAGRRRNSCSRNW